MKEEKVIKYPFTGEELEKLRNGCKNIRNLAIVDFLYSTGVRVSELCELNIKDINFYEGSCIVWGKGSKQREVYLNANAKLHLQEYLTSRTDKNEALFVYDREPYGRLKPQGVETMVRNLGKQCGIHKAHPHRFRRTNATNALNKGMPLEEVKEMLGHSKVDTTLIYCTVSRENVKHSHKKYMNN